MPLTSGTRLGPYEIVAALGSGGMGEVYKARDTRLDRLVAIKILPEHLAADPGRDERFQREARAVAALNHSHICALHDVGEAPSPESPSSRGSIRFLVMEYLDGQTLAERLLRAPLPRAELMRCAIEITDALDHAHRRGLVHRDLKPGNVMLTKAGAKLLDFGLSKLQARPDLVALSTVSPGVPLTAEGAVLGTFPYMAPEQLAGREADARSDIFAFGAMLYEMATGRRAFEGETAATVIGAVLHTDPPPLSTVQPLAPPLLDRLIARCLAKDPDNRWQTARDLTLELQWINEHDAPLDAGRRRGQTNRTLAMIAAAALAALAVASTVIYLRRTSVEDAAVRFSFSPPKELKQAEVRFGGPVTISPDGRRLLYVATGPDGRQLLWVHALDSPTPRGLPGTDGAAYPFWSPDGQFVAFFAEGRLKRISAAGGPPQMLSDAVLPRGGTWNRAGVIVFSAGAGRQLYQLSPGGVAMPMPADGMNQERFWPSFLPDGRHFVYFGRRQAPGIYVASLDLNGATLLASGLYMNAAYAPSGHLLLVTGGSMAGTLLAQPFDASRRQFTGEPVPLAEQVPFYPLFARADFSVSQNNTLVYGTFRGEPTQLAWFDRGGKQLAIVPGATGYTRHALSPDEKTIAADRFDLETQSQDVWLIETSRGVTSRLTTNPGHDQMGLWSPDGRRIVYGSTRPGEANGTRMKELSAAGADDPLFGTDDSQIHQMTDWSGDGSFIVYGRLDPKTKWDVWVVPATANPAGGERKPVPYLRTEFNEHHGRLSPDGRWMAYASDESGRSEVYVQSFPVPGPRTQVSTAGGGQPRWRRDGKELFYQSADRTLMVATVKADPTFTASAPSALFTMRVAAGATPMIGSDAQFEPSADGQRFLINVAVDPPPPPSATVILNWPATLRR
jgi:serine/threonine protein kinase/Tol biopolymer transport system component